MNTPKSKRTRKVGIKKSFAKKRNDDLAKI